MSTLYRNRSKPLYEQLAELIQGEIISEVRNPGDRIESMREMAKTHKVSLFTVQRTIANLKRKGLLRPEKGNGTFVAARTPQIDAETANNTIAFLSAYSIATQQNTPFFNRLLQGLLSAASAENKDLLCLAPQAKGRIPQPPDIMTVRHKNANGLIVLCYDYAYLLSLHNLTTPVVVADMDMSHAGLDSVTFDNADIGYQLSRVLIRKGAKRICYVPFARKDDNGSYRESGDPAIWERFSGIKRAMCEEGLGETAIPVINCDISIEGECESVVARLLALEPQPQGIFVHSDEMAVKLARSVERQGKQGLHFVGIGDASGEAGAKYLAACARADEYDMAAKCVELLQKRIREPQSSATRETIKMEVLLS